MEGLSTLVCVSAEGAPPVEEPERIDVQNDYYDDDDDEEDEEPRYVGAVRVDTSLWLQ